MAKSKPENCRIIYKKLKKDSEFVSKINHDNTLTFRWHKAIFHEIKVDVENNTVEYAKCARERNGEKVIDENGNFIYDYYYHPSEEDAEEIKKYILEDFNNLDNGRSTDRDWKEDDSQIWVTFTPYEIPKYDIIGFGILHYYGMMVKDIALKKHGCILEVTYPKRTRINSEGTKITIIYIVEFMKEEKKKISKLFAERIN